ncbi:MAG TPA: hypothetical protein VN181_11855 [Thermoanaerobaculia bacterium]|nr:hypothetical protein [Thermoanaerobaculia bacterium]
MDFRDVIAQLFERSNAMQQFWGFYITISGALLVFFGSAKRESHVTWILAVIFVLIAAFNLGGMLGVAKQRLMLRCLVERAFQQTAPDDVIELRAELTCSALPETSALLVTNAPPKEVIAAYLRAVHPPPVIGVVTLHLLCDATILASICFLQCSAARA